MNTMKYRKLLLGMVAVLALVASGFGQVAVTSTTLSSAVADSITRTVNVTSATGITAGTTMVYVDRELMDVRVVSGTVLTVVRGAGGTRAMPHLNAAPVYVGNASYFSAYAKFGSCVRANEDALPEIVASTVMAPFTGYIMDCFGSQWQADMNLPLYKLTVAPNAQPSATSPVAGAAIALTSQAGGAQSGTTSSGGAGGANSSIGGAGGIGGSSSGTAGAGGAANVIGGAGGAGPVTGGVGGLASFGGGAGGNGSSAGGSGGGLNAYSGAKGTGGTGTDGAINIRQGGAAGTAVLNVSTAGKTTLASAGSAQDLLISPSTSGQVSISDGTDPTKLVKFSVASGTTAVATTLSFAPTSARTVTVPDASITVASVVEKACGTTVTCSATTTNNVIVAYGSAALSSASPSTASITALPFTSSSTYWCTATPEGTTAAVAAGGIAINKTSGSAMTLTGPNTVTTVIDFVCHGT